MRVEKNDFNVNKKNIQHISYVNVEICMWYLPTVNAAIDNRE